MNRTNRILTAILILQIVIAAAVLWPRSGPASAGGAPLLADLTSDAVTSLTIEDGDGNSITLARKAGNWVLPAADDYPVQQERVSQLLDKLVALKTNRLVTKTAGSHKRLKVAQDDFLRRIDLVTKDDKKITLYLGSSPQPRATHVRAGGQDEVYLAADLASFDASVQPSGYVDTSYFSVPAADIVELTLQNAHGELTFVKDEAGNWTLADLAEGEAINSTNVSTLVNRASNVRLTRPLGSKDQPEYGLDTPNAVVILTTQGGEGDAVQRQTHTLRIGSQDPEDKSYVVAASQSPYYVRVAEFAVRDFVEKTRSDFLAEPTPVPETESGPPASAETPQP